MSTIQSSQSIHTSQTHRGKRMFAVGALLLLALAGTSRSAAAAPCLPANDGTECGGPFQSVSPSHAVQTAPVHSIAAITVKAKLGTYHLHVPHIYDIAFPRLTLNITGSHFRPDSRVSLEVINTSTGQVLVTASTRAQSTSISLCDQLYRGCMQLNPKAGTIAYRVNIDNPPSASSLEVRFQSGQYTGIQRVAL